MCGRGHAHVVWCNAYFGANWQIGRVVDNPMLLVSARHYGIAVAWFALDVEQKTEAVIPWTRRRAAILGERETAGIDQQAPLRGSPADHAGQYGNGDVVDAMGVDLRLKQVAEHVDASANFGDSLEV